MRYLAYITMLGMTFTVGCGSDEKTDSGDTGETAGDDDDDDDTTTTTPGLTVDVTWTDDGLTPEDTDGDSLPDINCDDSVNVTISDPLGQTSWMFGMAETGSPAGWYGEDCYLGYASFNFCHSIGIDSTITEVTDCSAMSVADGMTLLDAEKDPFLTYYLEDGTTGDCFVWGEDTTYYGPLSCTEMM
jgi:hypothetical protein